MSEREAGRPVWREPGDLGALGAEGRAAWSARVQACFASALERFGPSEFILAAPDARTTAVTHPDWTGFPSRLAGCLRRRDALALLDWTGESGAEGRRRVQEEYIEWRTVRDPDGSVRRVELTTELAAYWRVLAAHEPARALATIAAFAGEAAVAPEAVYADCDPFAEGVTPERRERAFAAAMLAPHGRSPYNTGVRAICCMVQRTNTLEALVDLAVAAGRLRELEDPPGGEQRRCLTATEAIPLLREAAQLARGSDPVLVERLGRLAYERRAVAFDDPPGVYIQGVEHTRLRQPDGTPVPAAWFRLERGRAAPDSHDGRSRHQRLVLEVPADAGHTVGDLVDVATEERVRYGGQIAELVQLVVLLRVSAAGAVAAAPCPPVTLDTRPEHEPDGCADVRGHHADFRAANEPAAAS